VTTRPRSLKPARKETPFRWCQRCLGRWCSQRPFADSRRAGNPQIISGPYFRPRHVIRAAGRNRYFRDSGFLQWNQSSMRCFHPKLCAELFCSIK
jgi:hypothetical protein